MGEALKSKIVNVGLVIMKKVNDAATKFNERSMAFLYFLRILFTVFIEIYRFIVR